MLGSGVVGQWQKLRMNGTAFFQPPLPSAPRKFGDDSTARFEIASMCSGSNGISLPSFTHCSNRTGGTRPALP